jgi:hypothetical protein
MRIDISGVYPIIKEQSFYEMLELKKTLFIWVPLTLALYCSASRLSTDLNALSSYELLTPPTFATAAQQYEGSQGSAPGVTPVGF